MTLKQARKKHGGYTQKELADLIGVSEVTVSNWERGITTPFVSMWKSVADALGVSMQEIEFKVK